MSAGIVNYNNENSTNMSSAGGFIMNLLNNKSSSKDIRFFLIVSGVFVFFGMHNFMQELIMSLPDFKTGIFLGYLEMIGVTLCAIAERYYAGDLHHAMKGRLVDYGMLCSLLLTSSGTSNLALGHINYPTKVVFRSCKLVPTMLVAVFFNRRNVQYFQFISGGLISIGMILFAAADFKAYPEYTAYGITLVSISVVADAFLPNLQERVFERGANRTEVSLYTNALSFCAMTLYLLVTGDLLDGVVFMLSSLQNFAIMTTYTLLACVAINFHMSLVQEFGGISAVIVGNTRKAMTIVLSFLIFPKPFSANYLWGGVLVFGSLIWSDYMKERHRQDAGSGNKQNWNKQKNSGRLTSGHEGEKLGEGGEEDESGVPLLSLPKHVKRSGSGGSPSRDGIAAERSDEGRVSISAAEEGYGSSTGERRGNSPAASAQASSPNGSAGQAKKFSSLLHVGSGSFGNLRSLLDSNSPKNAAIRVRINSNEKNEL